MSSRDTISASILSDSKVPVYNFLGQSRVRKTRQLDCDWPVTFKTIQLVKCSLFIQKLKQHVFLAKSRTFYDQSKPPAKMEPWWWKPKHKHKINANGSSDMKHFTELERVLGRCFNSNCVPIEISKLLSIINFIKRQILVPIQN